MDRGLIFNFIEGGVNMENKKNDRPAGYGKPALNSIYNVIGHDSEFKRDYSQHLCRYTANGLETIKFLSVVHSNESKQIKETMIREGIMVSKEIEAAIQKAADENDTNAVLTVNMANRDFTIRYFIKVERATEEITWLRKFTIGNKANEAYKDKDKNLKIQVGTYRIPVNEFLQEFAL